MTHRWISVRKKLPPMGARVLICGMGGWFDPATARFLGFDGDGQPEWESVFGSLELDSLPKYWMPMPPRPGRLRKAS